MDKIPVCKRRLPGTASLRPDPRVPGEVRRQVLIDAANVIMGTKGNQKGKKPLLGLLSLMRVFVEHDFEVVVFVSPKYYNPNVVDANCFEKFRGLSNFHIISELGPHVLDDLMCLEMANVTDGLVVSNDRFRDHTASSIRYASLVATNTGILDYKKADSEMRHKMTADGHYVANYTFEFPPHDKLFSNPASIRHELAEEQYEYWNPERKQAILETMDEILVELRQHEM